jgi:hypothetical protein
MTLPSRTLLLAAAALPALGALDVSDDDVKLGLKLNLQVRAEKADASNAAGADYSIIDGAGVDSDPVDFYVRRARIGFAGSYKGDYRFQYIIRIDNQDKSSSSSSSSIDPMATSSQSVNFNRRPETHVAFLERVFKSEDSSFEHSIRAGLDYAFFNSASVWGGSGMLLASRSTDQSAMLAPRGVGIGYKLTAPWVMLGVDVQNNVSDDAAGSGDGLCYTSRAHISPEGEWKVKGYQESWAGKPGKGLLVGVEVGRNVGADNGTTRTTTTAYGIDAVVHLDGLSALVEFRRAVAENTGTGAETKRQIILAQAGYAFVLENKTAIEPAVRVSQIDLNTDNDNETAPYTAAAEYGASGTQYEAGVNWYLNGNGHKLQALYQRWEAEEGEAEADVVRAQWAMSF